MVSVCVFCGVSVKVKVGVSVMVKVMVIVPSGVGEMVGVFVRVNVGGTV